MACCPLRPRSRRAAGADANGTDARRVVDAGVEHWARQGYHGVRPKLTSDFDESVSRQRSPKGFTDRGPRARRQGGGAELDDWLMAKAKARPATAMRRDMLPRRGPVERSSASSGVKIQPAARRQGGRGRRKARSRSLMATCRAGPRPR